MFPSEWHHSYLLTAGESDPRGLMPLTLVVERVIETATEHANSLNIGFADLSRKNIGWVLSRLAVEMTRYPAINERYSLTTWIESYNRHFSERSFVMTSDTTGEVLGYIRSVWVAIDMTKRAVADISQFEQEAFPISDRPCPIDRIARPPKLSPEAVVEPYTFKYCDLDLNRHVNTVRYIALILNHWSLSHFDTHTIVRFDICFHHECFFDERVELRVDERPDGLSVCEIARGDERAVATTIRWRQDK